MLGKIVTKVSLKLNDNGVHFIVTNVTQVSLKPAFHEREIFWVTQPSFNGSICCAGGWRWRKGAEPRGAHFRLKCVERPGGFIKMA